MELVEKVKATIRSVQDYPKPGITFKDITPVLADPVLVTEIIQYFVEILKPKNIEAVVGIEARGFILGSILAHELNCGFVPIRKAGKLPYKTVNQSYALEYGTAEIEMHVDALKPGCRVLVHDDLLATGGTAAAAGKLVQRIGGELVGFSFLINLGFLPGAQNLVDEFGVKPYYLLKY
jgi:adenine phosphoribosyltransferase